MSWYFELHFTSYFAERHVYCDGDLSSFDDQIREGRLQENIKFFSLFEEYSHVFIFLNFLLGHICLKVLQG